MLAGYHVCPVYVKAPRIPSQLVPAAKKAHVAPGEVLHGAAESIRIAGTYACADSLRTEAGGIMVLA